MIAELDCIGFPTNDEKKMDLERYFYYNIEGVNVTSAEEHNITYARHPFVKITNGEFCNHGGSNILQIGKISTFLI